MISYHIIQGEIAMDTINEKKKPKLIACYSPKGGVGKSTISTQLAVSAKAQGKKVCFYDLDPQKTASYYLNQIGDKYKPDVILHDFYNQAPPDDCDFIFLDCEPSNRFIPPKQFIIVAPTLASGMDLHAYRTVLELEQEGYTVIRVLNQYSMVRGDDTKVKEKLDPCVIIGQNTGIRHAMNNFKTVWNSNHPSGKKARNQFKYLISRILVGSAETLSNKDINAISLFGEIDEKGE